jgi:succinate dehydrogenase/fumarate reductase flavoprotein subunit
MRLIGDLTDEILSIDGLTVPVRRCRALVIGNGAAGLAAVLRLQAAGVPDVLLLTEDRTAGTSRNTGSDKQTYYKLTLAGDTADSVGDLAATLFRGGCMDGDLARVEAALSAECFYWLCGLGVPFPRNAFGEAVGYKTDHDPKSRATSAGPLTSRYMVEQMEQALQACDGPWLDGWQVIRLLTEPSGRRVTGVLCLNTRSSGRDQRYQVIYSRYIVLATGGPAMIYADSVYPGSQLGATGLALEAGALAQNLTEWQYGLASVSPRWNVSGSYQQVLPRYVSTDQDGGGAREFLDDWIPDEQERLGDIFRKGYQWPFDVRKLTGSSLIDLLVYHETVRLNRRVWLDFRTDPPGRAPLVDRIDEEAFAYLSHNGALQDTPYARLIHLNEPAARFYRDHGVDLAAEPLEIRLCAQHHNGGLAGDIWWASNLDGLYPIGEACGTHGVYRPGGSALNSGQVGALRAAAHIRSSRALPDDGTPSVEQISERIRWTEQCLDNSPAGLTDNLAAAWQQATKRMSQIAGPFRPVDKLAEGLRAVTADWHDLDQCRRVADPALLPLACRYRELLLVQHACLTAMLEHVRQGGGSRGSAAYLGAGGVALLDNLPDDLQMLAGRTERTDLIQTVRLARLDPAPAWLVGSRPVAALPQPDQSFEQVWRTWREEEEKR